MPNFSSAHQGILWSQHFRRDFPHVEEKSCLEEVLEPFGEQIGSPRGMGIRVTDKPGAPRLWARSEDGSNVLQIQKNAIIMNWLRNRDTSAYVDYGPRRTEFVSKLQVLSQFLAAEHLGECEPTSCLMTYVNHIEIDSLEVEGLRAADVFTFFRNETNSGWLPSPDQLTINMSYPMPDKRGRLHLQINPAIKVVNDQRRFVMRFDLTARGTPEANTLESALGWLDMGHEWIVRGFVDFTRTEWQSTWEREI
ncbi:MAG: TIGR04255 family protein [Pirellulales bacterium]